MAKAKPGRWRTVQAYWHMLRNKLNVAVLLTVSLTACSPRDFLTRRLAADLISGSTAFSAQQQFVLRTGIVTSKDYPSPEYLVLQHHGWISATTVACTPGLAPSPCWDVLLTPSGVDAVRAIIPAEQADKSSISIPVAKRELVSATGIARQDNSADVEFEWKWVPLNEIGEGLYSRDLRYRASVGFRKYDDGWRLVENAPRSGQSLDDALKNSESIP
jgi:hypothetical protein